MGRNTLNREIRLEQIGKKEEIRQDLINIRKEIKKKKDQIARINKDIGFLKMAEIHQKKKLNSAQAIMRI